MKIALIVIFAIAVILAFSTVVIAGPEKHNKVRVIAHTDDEVSRALGNDCREVKRAKTLTALECPKDVAQFLGLQEDIKVFAMDSSANKQVRADLVHGNNTGAGRKIVIIDTGYNYNHPELTSSYLGGKDFVNDDNDPMDDNGHGSHVAGLITGDGIDPKAKGVAPAAGIISGKVLAADGSGYFSDVVEAIYWAVDGPDGIAGTTDDFKSDAISMSLGTSPPYTYRGFCDGVLPDLTNAIKYARSRGILVVVAAGNSGGAGVSIPGCVSYSTTVGAVDKNDKIASFSGIGNAVDVTAPGVSLLSAWLGSSYVTASGTSMATPVVSVTIALIKVAHPNYSATQVENALFKTAKDLGRKGKDTSFGWGRIDAYSAVKFVA